MLVSKKQAVNLQNDFIVMRHGHSLGNELGLIVSRPENALAQYGLTADGEQQVSAAISKANLNQRTLIVSSDFARALDTAKLAQRQLNVAELCVDARFRERDFGNWELQDHSAYHSIWEDDLSNPDQPRNGVEAVSSVLSRALAGLSDLDQNHVGRQILIVSHGDVLQILLAFFAGIPIHHHRSLASLGNAELRSLVASEYCVG